MASKEKPSLMGNWKKFPLKGYHQIWSQLTLDKSVLYCISSNAGRETTPSCTNIIAEMISKEFP